MDDLTPQDKDMMVRTIIGEAGDQPVDGQAAVAHVILNRARSGQYGGDTPTSVVLAPHQFEPWQTRSSQLMGIKPDSTAYKNTAALVDDVVSGARPDPTNGATYFLNPDIVKARRGGTLPSWAQGPGQQIGEHTFYGGAPKTAQADDLLEGWGAGSTAAAAQAPASAASTAAPSNDLLESWGNDAAPTQTPSGGLHITVHPTPKNPPPPGEPTTLPEQVIAAMAQHRGDGFGDTAIRAGLGTVRGIGDVGDTLAQGVGYTGDTGARALQSAGIISPQSAQAVSDWHAGINRDIAAGQAAYMNAGGDAPSAQLGRIGGNILGTAPLMEGAAATLIPNALRATLAFRAAPAGANVLARTATASGNVLRTIAQGAGAGATVSGLTSSTSDDSLLSQMRQGAEAGAVLAPAGAIASRGLSKVFGGGIDQATAALAQKAKQYGINVGPGQLSNNTMTRFLDSVLRRLPLTGYGSQTAAQQTALERAVAGEMGQTADKVTSPVVRNALHDIGQEYDAINNNIGTLNVDRPFVNDLLSARTNAHANLEPVLAKRVDGHINNILSKVDRGSMTIDPDKYQILTRKNGPLDKAIQAKDTAFGGYASDLKDALEGLVWRNDPALKAAKDAADYKYFVTKSVQPMVDESPTGGISPSKLLSAVNASHTDVGALGRISKRFMVEPPSSGTAERAFWLQHAVPSIVGLTGLGGLGAGVAHWDPDHWQRDVGIGALSLLGTRGASNALRSNLISNAMIRRGLSQQTPALNALSGHYLPAAGAITNRNQSLPALSQP